MSIDGLQTRTRTERKRDLGKKAKGARTLIHTDQESMHVEQMGIEIETQER